MSAFRRVDVPLSSTVCKSHRSKYRRADILPVCSTVSMIHLLVNIPPCLYSTGSMYCVHALSYLHCTTCTFHLICISMSCSTVSMIDRVYVSCVNFTPRLYSIVQRVLFHPVCAQSCLCSPISALHRACSPLYLFLPVCILVCACYVLVFVLVQRN